MKTTNLKTAFAALILALVQLMAHAQQGSKPQFIVPYPIGITYAKTTNIIFPQAILSVDRGSRDILAQKAKGVENILQVKAARENFPETNLTVVTADGKLSSFTVSYSAEPQVLNLALNTPQYTRVTLSQENRNMAEIQKYARAVFHSAVSSTVTSDRNSDVVFSINGFFIHDDILYCNMSIENSTNIGYDIDQLRFFICDQQKTSRVARQEIEVSAVYVENDTSIVDAQHTRTMVFAFPKFTIPDRKFLAIQLYEKNGGRHMEVHVRNRKIIKAKPIKI